MYIAISGNIGSGKTTLVEMLSERLGWRAFYEDISNPYLDDFYNDMERWAFKMQVAFFTSKIEQLVSINSSNHNIIQDRTVFEEAHIFVENLHDSSLMTTRDYELYMKLFTQMTQNVRIPDLVIYLKGSVDTFIAQIHKRGREFELGISREYLERLNNYYNNWIENIYIGRVIVVDIDNDDFLLEDEVFENIVNEIKRVKSEL